MEALRQADPWLIALGIGLVLTVAAALSLPALARLGVAAPRRAAALAVFKDQLAEIDRDETRGLIDGAEAEAARIEIKRRMIAAAPDATLDGAADEAADEAASDASVGGSVPARRGANRIILVGALLTPLLGIGIYTLVGRPDLSRMPVETPPPQSLEALADRIRERLLAGDAPNEAEGWRLVARTYAGLGRHGEAADAYARIANRPDTDAETLALYARSLIEATEDAASPQAVAILERALSIDADDVEAVMLRAAAFERAGDREAALSLLDARLARGGDAGEVEAYRDALAGLPPPETVAAAEAMSETDRAAFIRSMVDGLAARLEAEPDDFDGWMRLANAYRVLNERENAARAYRGALDAAQGFAPDDPRRAAASEALGAFDD